MTPRLGLLVLLSFLVMSALPAQAQVNIPAVSISGGGLAGEVQLAPLDADAFRRRINLPPRLDDGPEPQGESYTVTTAYWDEAIRREDNERRITAEEAATYFPNGGFVRIRFGGEDTWIVLDLRQRALLDRYIRLSKAGEIGRREGALGVLRAVSRSEPIGIDAGVKPFEAGQRSAFWSGLGDADATFLDPPQPPEGENGYWLLFTPAGDQGYQYFYDGSSLTDLFGTERYSVTGQLKTLLDGITPSLPEVENEDPPGSLLWWPVMGGGGLLMIAAAVWLQRRSSAGT